MANCQRLNTMKDHAATRAGFVLHENDVIDRSHPSRSRQTRVPPWTPTRDANGEIDMCAEVCISAATWSSQPITRTTRDAVTWNMHRRHADRPGSSHPAPQHCGSKQAWDPAARKHMQYIARPIRQPRNLEKCGAAIRGAWRLVSSRRGACALSAHHVRSPTYRAFGYLQGRDMVARAAGTQKRPSPRRAAFSSDLDIPSKQLRPLDLHLVGNVVQQLACSGQVIDAANRLHEHDPGAQPSHAA